MTSAAPAHRVSGNRVTTRLASVDAYRGLVILLMLAEVLASCEVSAAVPSLLWQTACHAQTHAAWVGWHLHDLIQPSFYFLVGMGIYLSLNRRSAEGQPVALQIRHALLRSLVLIFLGMALFSIHPRQWKWQFMDTLSQIGLAYPFAFLIALRPKRDWYLAAIAVLVGYWLWFATAPLHSGIAASHVGASPEWMQINRLHGFYEHWQKNDNPAFRFDVWFLNLFPQQVPYNGDVTGLETLNFIPSIATMVLGLVAADILRSQTTPAEQMARLTIAGVILIAVGWTLGAIGVCPVVKAIWTPSWVLFSGGWCFLFAAGFYALVDLAGFRLVVFPLTVLGVNSVVAYAMSHVYPALAFNGIRRVVGNAPFEILGHSYEPLLYGAAILLMYWTVTFVLYQRRIFVKL